MREWNSETEHDATQYSETGFSTQSAEARSVRYPHFSTACSADTEKPLFVWPHDVGHPRQKVEKAMAKACKVAGIPHYHPHDLRHRRITLWHGQGIPAREIGDRVGQRQVSTTLDIYTHVMPPDEVPESAYRRLLRPVTRASSRSR